MKRKAVSLPTLIAGMMAAALVTAVLILALVPNPVKGWIFGSDSLSKYFEIKQIIDNSFVEDVDDAALADGVGLGMIYTLDDRYSTYYTAEQYTSVKNSNEGVGAGIGVTISEHPDTGNLYIVNVSVDSPADKAGIRAADQITAVDGKQVTELGYSKAVSAVRGDSGTSVKLTLLRGNKELTVTATRGEYVSTSVFSHMIGTLCYIQITDFNAATVGQFETAVNDAQSSGATGLIFDLRGNGGGTLDSVEKMLDILLPEGDVVSATYKNGNKRVLFTSDKYEVDLPMTVLTDENTASASELFAAAIRDYNKGALIGENTFGKGIMQRTFELSDGSAVRMTIAYFNPPSGVNFHEVGLAPDVEVKMTDEQKERRYLLDDDTDPVIAAAVKYLSK